MRVAKKNQDLIVTAVALWIAVGLLVLWNRPAASGVTDEQRAALQQQVQQEQSLASISQSIRAGSSYPAISYRDKLAGLPDNVPFAAAVHTFYPDVDFEAWCTALAKQHGVVTLAHVRALTPEAWRQLVPVLPALLASAMEIVRGEVKCEGVVASPTSKAALVEGAIAAMKRGGPVPAIPPLASGNRAPAPQTPQVAAPLPKFPKPVQMPAAPVPAPAPVAPVAPVAPLPTQSAPLPSTSSVDGPVPPSWQPLAAIPTPSVPIEKPKVVDLSDVLDDMDFRGPDLASETTSSMAACNQLCLGAEGCAAWTWKRSSARCYLKSAPVPTPTPSNCCVSRRMKGV